MFRIGDRVHRKPSVAPRDITYSLGPASPDDVFIVTSIYASNNRVEMLCAQEKNLDSRFTFVAAEFELDFLPEQYLLLHSPILYDTIEKAATEAHAFASSTGLVCSIAQIIAKVLPRTR
jgi:hypothetical protein